MDPVIKWGMIFGLIGMVASGFFGFIMLGCCAPFSALIIGAVCGAVVALGSLKAKRSTLTPPGPGIPEPLEAGAPGASGSNDPEPVKDAAKACSIAGLFCFTGQFFGGLMGHAIMGPATQKMMEEMFSEWGVEIPEATSGAEQFGQWIGAAIGSGCCGALDFALFVGGGVLVAWSVVKMKQ